MNENRYKKAMDDVCDKNFNLTATEMLEKAKASAKTERNITMKKSTKKNLIRKIILTSAACLIITGTAASAIGIGPLGESFRHFFGQDEITAEIIDQGHYCNIGQEQSDGMFTVKLDSVTGDTSSPKLIFEVTVNDEMLAEKNDRLHLSAYILDEYNYKNHLDEYGMCEAYGNKDPEVSNLYHVCLDGPSAFMVNEAEVITAVRQISFDSDPGNQIFDYEVDMEYRFKVPNNALKNSYFDYFNGITLSSGKVDYNLNYAEYGSYESLFGFTFNFLGTDLAGGETDYNYLIDKFDMDWHEYARDFVLTVDGVEYSAKDVGFSYCIADVDPCVTDGETVEAGKCSTWMSFPGIDYTRAEKITLTAGGETYILK